MRCPVEMFVARRAGPMVHHSVLLPEGKRPAEGHEYLETIREPAVVVPSG